MSKEPNEIKETEEQAQSAPQAPSHELSESELDQTAGGKVSFNPFSVTRKFDKSSPIFS